MNQIICELFLDGNSVQEIKEQTRIPLYQIRDILVEEGLLLMPDINKHGYLYVIKCEDKIKVGRTREVESRLKQLQTGNPYVLELVNSKYYENEIIEIERKLHEELKPYQVLNEWFTFNHDVLIILQKYF